MKLSKKSIAFRTLSTFGAIFIFLIFIAGPLAVFLFLPLLGLVGGYHYLYWKNFEYYFEDGDLKIQSGVLTKNSLDIPIRRIQDIDIKKGVLQRAFGIAEVNIKTAGGDISKASLRYLEEDEAENVKEKLRQLKNRRENEEDDKVGQTQEPERFYEIGDSLLTYSLLAGVPGAVILGVLFTVIAVGASAFFASTVLQMVGYSIGLIILALLAAGTMYIAGAVNKYIQYYDFHVDKRSDVFEYERGMMNKEGGSLPEEKIQKIEVTENFLMRYFGYATLKAETAGVMNTDEEITTSTKVLIPLDTREEVYRHARDIGELEFEEMNDIGPIAKERYFRRYIAGSTILLLASVSLIYVGLHPLVLVLPLTAYGLSKKASTLKWQNIGYSKGSENLMVMKGFWNRKTYAVPYFRSQNLMVSQSVFQRRWDLATVTVDTAGNKYFNPKIVDLEESKAQEIRDELFEKFQNSVYGDR